MTIPYVIEDTNTATDGASIVFNVGAANDTPIVDLNSVADPGDSARGATLAYTEGDGAVTLAGPAADVDDRGEGDIERMTITLAGFDDAASEQLTIAGRVFDVDTARTDIAVALGGESLDIAYTPGAGGTGVFTITRNGGGALDPDALDTLVRGARYENASEAPNTATARTLTFTVTDDGTAGGPAATSDPAVATINLTATPDAFDDSFAGNEDGGAIAVNVLAANPTFADDPGAGFDGAGDVVVGTLPPPAQGVLSFEATPGTAASRTPLVANSPITAAQAATLEFAPATDFNGTVTFGYQIQDANDETASATATIVVSPTPDATDDTLTLAEDAPETVFAPDILANDDAGAGLGTVTIPSAPPSTSGTLRYTEDGTGSVIDVADGATLSPTEAATLRFEPGANFNGTVNVGYRLNDTGGNTSDATLRITVSAENDAPIVDLNSGASAADADRDTSVTFTEGGALVAVAPAPADVSDIGEADIASLRIAVGAVPDGAEERVAIGGTPEFALDGTADAAFTATLGGTTFRITYDGANIDITRDGGGTIPQADLDALVRSVQYRNVAASPTAGDRDLVFTATDDGTSAGTGGALTSTAAVATVSVVSPDDTPLLDLNSAASTADTARGNSVTFTEDGGPVALADAANAGVEDFAEGDLASLTITPAGIADGASETLVLNDGAGRQHHRRALRRGDACANTDRWRHDVQRRVQRHGCRDHRARRRRRRCRRSASAGARFPVREHVRRSDQRRRRDAHAVIRCARRGG